MKELWRLDVFSFKKIKSVSMILQFSQCNELSPIENVL